MTLLSGHSLTARDRFQPETMSLNLEERNSNATITLGPEAPEIGVKDWIRDDTEPGKGIVWRVKSVTENMETRTRTIALEHCVQALKDLVLFGEIQPKDITGKSTDKKCTAKQAVNYILGKQKDWKLGEMAKNPSNPYSFSGDTLYAALETVTGSLQDVQWEYDFSSYPFTLHLRAYPAGFQSEMRMSRNITSLRRQIDRSRMFTRFYPIGKNNLKLGGNHYVQKNTDLYGVICKVETDQSLDTTEKLEAWANKRLNRHAQPTVTITISGQDLSTATGEALDKIQLGKNCRVPLPEYGTTIQERVTKLSWSDKIGKPTDMTVTMANNLEDVAKIINNLQKNASSGGRAGAKNSEEDHAWINDTTEKVEIVAEAVGGKGPDGKPNWSRVSQLTVDGNGIDARVTKTEGGLVTAQSKITQTENSISQVVTAVGKNGKVTAASIVTAINNDESEIRISADKIYLEGNVSLNSVLKVLSNTATFTGLVQFGTDTATRIRIGSGYVSTPNIRIGSGTQLHTVNFAVLDKMIKEASLSGNTLTLTRFDGSKINFSKAITLSGQWGGRKFTATPSAGTPLVTELRSSVPNSKRTISGNTVTMTIQATIGDSETFVDCGNITVTIPDLHPTQYSMAKGYNTDDSVYYGKLYNSSGQALTSNNYYWYGCSTNVGGGQSSVNFWR